MTGFSLRRLSRVLVAAGFVAGGASLAAATTDTAPEKSAEAPAWDQIANIRGAAERLGRLHRARGAKAAYELIDNCYKTHSLASTYGEGFEACIVQDYLETRTLIQIYSRMPPDALEKMGVPSPQMLADTMGQRISAAFHQYQKTQAYADEVRRLVDQHGLPVFVAIVFPEAVQAIENEKTKQKKK